MIVKIAYFSGTGCTQFVAESFKNEVEARNNSVLMIKIGKDISNNKEYDLLILCYVVHAFNAPKPVLDWVNKNKALDNVPTAIISVSGGGEVSPNLACRLLLKKKLTKSNYSVFYEKMIVMPSNWIVSTKPKLVNKLFDILPYKISYYVNDILNKKISLYSPGIGNRFISMVGKLEHYGAVQFGKKIKVNEFCNGCGLCEKKCPVGNIVLQNNKPLFKDNCSLCLQCIYCCPGKALVPGIAKFVIIKEGFNFPGLLNNRKKNVLLDIKKETKGYLWLGVRRYLLDNKEMHEPSYKEPSDI
ncbi:MAG: EFR1 family ferrodoxin [Spirochaetaceae bacterium]